MFIKDAKDIVKNISDIVTAPAVNIMLLLGFLLVALSFCRVNNVEGFSFTSSPIWVLIIFGCLLLLGSPIMFIFTREDRRINKKVTIQKGVSFSLNQLSVNLMVGKIQEISPLAKGSAVVLPANSSFIDDCITDEKSALGAFFLKFHPDKIPRAANDIEEQLRKQGCQKEDNGLYPLGTTIILPQEYDTPAKCILTASTIREAKTGIRAEPSSICESIKQVFMITSDKKIEKLYIPILGSGHGGLEINNALLFLVLAMNYYSKSFHHLRAVDVIVTEADASKLKDVYRLQYISFLETRQK